MAHGELAGTVGLLEWRQRQVQSATEPARRVAENAPINNYSAAVQADAVYRF